ncbi:hypothetical protein A3B48_03735 [Candidatus Gottesmanbacteria bacterium RIFCSPLOWO2_01_FULL_40_10]|nr:MAG: hypothetical protein A3B48_03735 [Candidatus Gottesmanbacteria bacterium RIFCSPLOWO2_01_FULL_40_10]
MNMVNIKAKHNKTTLIIMRHGEVENLGKVLYGRLPGFGLSQKGILQVISSAEKLQGRKISAIYTSPMLRARQTGAILSRYFRIHPKISSLITEVNIIYQGMALDSFRKEIQSTLYTPVNLKKGQESIESISDRMMRFVHLVNGKHPGETVIAVSHGDPILILKCNTIKRSFTWSYKKNNYIKTGDFMELEIKEEKYNWK